MIKINFSEKVKIILSFIAVFLVALVVAIPLGISKLYLGSAYAQAYPTATKVGYHAEYLGNVKRNIPTETHDGGLATGYPTYGRGMSLTQEQRQALINEADSLTAVGTWVENNRHTAGTYDSMDAESNLYLNGQSTGRKLYKHTGSVGLYGGNVSDDEPGVVKKLYYKNRGGGYNITGLYAPAGEVIKIKVSESDLAKTNGLVVYIGQALYNGQANNIWAAKGVMNRMPVILNQMILTTSTYTAEVDENGNYTFYVGSYLGGPIYLRPGQSSSTAEFSVTISGGVNYSHYILGYTTEEEFNQNAKSSVPFFDLMVWEGGVLHSGPKVYAQNFSYKQLYDAAIYWEKVSAVSTRVKNTSCGIVFLYDPFVAAGAAVAFPGRNSVNCPMGWMSNSLNRDGLVTSGAWGNMHEYNHNFQGFGLPGGGEVTNNSLTLAEYAMFTNISASRKIGSFNEGQGGWNRYTSASWSIMQGSNGFGRENQLSIYSTLLHCYGADNFIKTACRGGTDNYFGVWSETTKNDMTWFANYVGYPLSDEKAEEMATNNYPMFVPVGSIYQTGRSYTFEGEKKYIETMKPYIIPYGNDFTIDLRKYTFDSNRFYQYGSVALPEDFSFNIKQITQPENGKITETETNGVYTFTPNKKSMLSGKIYVTIEITKDDEAFLVDDVDLVLEFEQSHELNKNTLTRTTYTYQDDNMYTSAVDAFTAKYAGYESVEAGDNNNPVKDGRVVQNCNSDIWYIDLMPANKVVELSGKMHIDETAKYRIALRGRWNCALYVSLDGGKTYELAATRVQTSNDYNFSSSPETYKDYELEGGTWLYFKAVMLTGSKGGTSSFIGVGWGKFTPPVPIFEGDEIVGETPETVSVSYATAYRESYEFATPNFNSEYLYKRQYTENYNKEYGYMPNAKIVSINSGHYQDANVNLKIENILDEDDNNAFHSDKLVSENPVELIVDLGEEITANRFVLKGYLAGSTWHVPNTFKLYLGTSVDNLTEVLDIANGSVSGDGTIASYFNTDLTEASKTFRYYKIVITGTNRNRYVAFRWLKFYHNIPNGRVVSLDDEMYSYKGKWEIQTVYSTFGHIYAGKNVSMSFTFEGNQFGIKSYFAKGYKEFEVLIDGKKVADVDISERKNQTDWAYISPYMKNGTHKVTIRSKKMFNIDSIALW